MLHTDDEIEEVHIRPDGTWSIAAPGGESEKEDGEEEDHPAKVKTSLSEDCKDTAASRTGLGSTPLEHTDSSSLQALGNGSAGTSGAGQAAPTHDVIDLCLSSDEDEPAPPVPSRVAAPIPPVPTRVAAPTVARLPVRPAPAQATVPAVTRPPPKVAAAVPPTQPTKPATARPSTPLPVRTPSTQQKPAARQATSDSDAEDFQNVHWKRKKNVVMSSSSSEGGLESGSETEDESRKVSSNLAPSNRVDSGSNARLQRSLRQRRPVNYADPDDFSDDDLEAWSCGSRFNCACTGAYESNSFFRCPVQSLFNGRVRRLLFGSSCAVHQRNIKKLSAQNKKQVCSSGSIFQLVYLNIHIIFLKRKLCSFVCSWKM